MKVVFELVRRQWFHNVVLQFFVIIFVGLWLQINPAFEATINALWQFLPTSMLEKYGFSSLYYLHQQPPLLNGLVIVIIEAWGISSLERGISLIMLAMLFANLVLMNLIVETLSIRKIYSWIFVTFPSFWLYHTWFYEPIFTLFFTNLALLGLIKKPSPSSFLIFVSGMIGLTLAHGSFHPIPVFIIIALAWALIFRSERIAKIWFVVVALALLPIAFMAKNIVLVGSPTLSSWAGCNLHQKFMMYGTGFDYTPKEIKGLPEIVGAVSFGEQKKPNTNNLDFAAHCNDNLRLIISHIAEPGFFSGYLSRVTETVRNNESALSIEYRGAGFSPGHWGRLNVFIDWLSTRKAIYAFPLLLLSIFGPILALALSTKTPWFKILLILNLIYYFALALGHLANGWEQMRMAYRSSFFLYLSFLFSVQMICSRLGFRPVARNDKIG